jgi:uncharacterized membrane protein
MRQRAVGDPPLDQVGLGRIQPDRQNPRAPPPAALDHRPPHPSRQEAPRSRPLPARDPSSSQAALPGAPRQPAQPKKKPDLPVTAVLRSPRLQPMAGASPAAGLDAVPCAHQTSDAASRSSAEPMASTHEHAALRARFARRTRYLHRRPRLVLSVLLGILAHLALPTSIGEGTRLLGAFDLAAFAFLGAVWIMMARATTAGMRRRSQIEDEGRYVVLALSAATAVAILLAIALELHHIRDQPPAAAGLRVTLAALTILLAWSFMNTIFALHYAHFFYGDAAAPAGADDRGLAFPGRAEPDYWDFLYFSFTIGMTFQVSDVQIENHRLRRIALAHGVLAFFFNVVVLALTINIIAGLL